MLEIYVDADACPVKEEVLRVASRHKLAVFMVGNTWMRMAEEPLVKRVVVSQGADAADDWIAERIGEDDIAVTADIPLAARCLDKGAWAIGPAGKPFTEANIGDAVATRELMAHLRNIGEVKGNNPSFSKQDRSRFLGALEETIQAILRRRANAGSRRRSQTRPPAGRGSRPARRRRSRRDRCGLRLGRARPDRPRGARPRGHGAAAPGCRGRRH